MRRDKGHGLGFGAKQSGVVLLLGVVLVLVLRGLPGQLGTSALVA